MNSIRWLIAALLIFIAGPHDCCHAELSPKELQASIRKAVDKVLSATVAIADSGDRRVAGAFSGVIVSPEGHVLTAGHAVEPNQDYQVILTDGRRFAAKGMGREIVVDCGLIKITQTGKWPYAEMGWSAVLERNQPCLSLGHPGRFDKVRGPVVRFGRIVEPLSPIKGFIQTTCLMEPGDSGGPLFDLAGRIIGIHSMVFQSPENNYEVPVDQFRRYWEELNQPKAFRAWDVVREPQFGIRFGRRRNRNRGVKISDIAEESIAAKAGLKEGDRITAIDGRSVRTAPETTGVLYRCYVLQKKEAEVKIQRDGKQLSIPLTIPKRTDSARDQHLAQQDYQTSSSSADSLFTSALPEMENLAAEFRDQESQLDDAIAIVASKINGEPQRIFATILANRFVGTERDSLAADGSLLISKSSMVGDQPIVELPDSITAAAEIVARDDSNDLVLLKIEKKAKGGLEPSSLGSQVPDAFELGKIFLTPRPAGAGLISVLGSPTFVARKRESTGFLGVELDVGGEHAVLEKIIPDSAASKVDLAIGDGITRINDVTIRTWQQMVAELQKYMAGDRVTLEGVRGETEFVIEVELDVRPETETHTADMFKNGKSKRRDGFKMVFAHDAKLKPSECGGPLFGLDGDLVGINIARFSRSRSYAIPAHVVKRFVLEAVGKQRGQEPPST